MTTNDERAHLASFSSTSKQRAHELALSWAAEAPPGECPLYRAHRLLDEASINKAGFQCIWERYLASSSSYSPTLSEDDTDFLGQLRDRIWAGLQKGAYSLTGVIKRDLVDGDARRKTFAAEWVKAVALNWEDDSASLNGEVIAVNIEVEVATSAPSKRKKGSVAEVKRWHAEWVRSWETNGSYPGREQTRAAARLEFGREHRKLLDSLRPDHWPSPGRPRGTKNSAK